MEIKNLSDDSGETKSFEILEKPDLEIVGSTVRIIVKTTPPNPKGFPGNSGNLRSLGLQAEAAALELDIRRQELAAKNPNSSSSTRVKP